MRNSINGLAWGLASGVLVGLASVHTIGYTAAFAMPAAAPVQLWDALVVFGLGAGLVAFLVHLAALRLSRSAPLPLLRGFACGAIGYMAASGLLVTGGAALAAWFIGALAASLVAGQPRKPATPAPGAA